MKKTTDGRTLDHATLEYLRELAVHRVINEHEQPSAVIHSLGLCRTSIYPWLRNFKAGGATALKKRVARGRDPRLNERQAFQVRKWILGKDPRQYGYDYGLWTRTIVKALIREQFSISIGLTAVGRLLARMNITPQKPLRRAYERDPKAITEWKENLFPALKRRAKRYQAKIFFSDEAGFQSDPPLGRTYGLKGNTPIVKTSGQRQSINAISAVNARGEFWSVTYDGKLNAETFGIFLRNFMRNRRTPVFLIVDGHPAHRAKSIRDFIATQRGKLELHFLPPYAP